MSTALITSVPDFKAFARASDDEAAAHVANSSSQVFGSDGLSFGDVLDAINPLNHIPIVADVFANITGHKASAGARLAGGALFGGPIGVAASIATLLFEEGAGGKSPAEALYAAVTGSEPSTQMATNDAVTPARVARADGSAQTQAAAPVEPIELASLAPAPSSASSRIPIVDAAKNALSKIPVNTAAAVLDLYGASAVSAHGSYKKAQMLPYLRDVTVSKVL